MTVTVVPYTFLRSISQSFYFSDAGYKSGSHEADVDLQLKGFSFIGLLR